jgi:hypothetical protein
MTGLAVPIEVFFALLVTVYACEASGVIRVSGISNEGVRIFCH